MKKGLNFIFVIGALSFLFNLITSGDIMFATLLFLGLVGVMLYYYFTYCNLSSFKWVSSEFITYTLNCRLTSKNNFNVYVDFTLNGEINIPHNSTMVPL